MTSSREKQGLTYGNSKFSATAIARDGGWVPAIVTNTGQIVEEGEYIYGEDEMYAALKEAKDLLKDFMKGKL